MSFNSTFEVRHPTQAVAPFLETGTKIPENMKLYRGYATFTAPAAADERHYLLDIHNTTQPLVFKPGSVVIAATVKSATALGGGTDPFDLGLSPTIPNATPPTAAPAWGETITSAITSASIDIGVSLPIAGAIAGNTAVSPMVNNTSRRYWPVLRSVYAAGGATGTIYVTMLVLECYAK